MCSGSIFNLLKRVTDGNIYMQNVSFCFSTFLKFACPNKFPQNQYTNHKSALDQSLLNLICRSMCKDLWSLLVILRMSDTKQLVLPIVGDSYERPYGVVVLLFS